MSETVILSKTSSRQRPPQPTTGAATAADTTIPSLGGNTMVVGGSESVGRLEKLASKGKASSAASLARVKELVHRDNSRLVKDLMALLAIREATKEVVALPPTPPPPPPPPPPSSSAPQSNSDDGAGRRRRKPEQKNRPGDDDTATAALHDDGAAGEAAGTKAAATAAAVASLLHRTATKQFSSLAGEIIAIADDDDADDGPEHEDDRPTARSSNANEAAAAADEIRGTGNDGAMMLHADAAAAPTTDLSTTNERPTDDEEREELEKLFPERSEQDAEKDEVFPAGRWWCDQQHSGATKTETARDDGSKLPQRPKVGCFLSGPVSPAEGACLVRTAGAGTPIPPDLGLGAAVQQHHHHPPAVSLTLEQKLDKLLDSVVKIKADMHRRIDRLGKRVEQIHLDVQLNIDSTDRALLRNDLLLIGIPHREREDLQACFRAVCRALEYGEQDIPQVDIRRQRVTGGSSNRHHPPPKPGGGGGGTGGEPCAPPPAPIVVEFMFKTLRDQFYRAYQAKRVLRLSDLGFASDRRFFVNEVLTKYNQKLMAEAVRRKRLGLLHSVYTVDGIVYVQRVAGEKGTKVTSFSSMN